MWTILAGPSSSAKRKASSMTCTPALPLAARSMHALKLCLDGAEEAAGLAARYGAMIEGERERERAAGGQALAAHHGTRGDAPGAQDGDLRRHHDEGRMHSSERAEVRERDGGAAQGRGRDGAAGDRLLEGVDLASECRGIPACGIEEHRHEEPVAGVEGDPD